MYNSVFCEGKLKSIVVHTFHLRWLLCRKVQLCGILSWSLGGKQLFFLYWETSKQDKGEIWMVYFSGDCQFLLISNLKMAKTERQLSQEVLYIIMQYLFTEYWSVFKQSLYRTACTLWWSTSMVAISCTEFSRKGNSKSLSLRKMVFCITCFHVIYWFGFGLSIMYTVRWSFLFLGFMQQK